MSAFARHWPRIALTLIPVVFAMLHAMDVLHLDVLTRLDYIFYDARLRAASVKTLDERIVIIDIDEKSLAEEGHWPWPRNKLAALMDKLFGQQHVSVVGVDMVFAEADESSGLQKLNALAQNELRDQGGFVEKLRQLQGSLDYDQLFAASVSNRPVVLSFYLNNDANGRTSGVLPAPLFSREMVQGHKLQATVWSGFGSNIPTLAKAAPNAGFFNSITDPDGVVRSLPLIAEYKGQFYPSLSLAIFRVLAGMPEVMPGFTTDKLVSRNQQGMDRVLLKQGNKVLPIPVDEAAAVLVPYRGTGGVNGGSYRYVSASDVLSGKIAPDALKDKIILIGTTAPGLLDLRVTPVGEVYPGVEAHANLISGFLDGNLLVKPDYSLGYEVVVVLLAGLLLAFSLPLLTATRAVLLSASVLGLLLVFNILLFTHYGLVLPLANSLVMVVTAFALNMSYGYFVESRSKRELAHLFGTYVPPELVDEMVKDPDSYNMQAANRELTVMFCDMRGFTAMSEKMEPQTLQALLNNVFSRLTEIIRSNRGTIDKYMGDCVMAFWGAPVESPDHAHSGVKAAMEMANAVRAMNHQHREAGLPEIGVGIGLNTGTMCVGDMGSNIRRSYTVIGDAVNLGSRLEGLSKTYGVDIVVSETTRRQANDFLWQELDLVRVKGKAQAVSIYWPVAPSDRVDAAVQDEIKTWQQMLKAYRAQNWDQADVMLINLMRMNPKKYLYKVYSDRVAAMRHLPPDPAWDGATNFETK